MQNHTKLRAFELADEVALLVILIGSEWVDSGVAKDTASA